MREFFLQIQPKFEEREKWIELAESENLFYEPIEMYMAPALANAPLYNELNAWHRSIGRIRSIHGAFIDVNPASASPTVRDHSRKCCEESCVLAKELGAEWIVFHSSCAPFLRAAYIDNWANITAQYFMELAEKHDLTICIENSMDIDSVPLQEIMKRVSGNRVQVCLDLGHVNYSLEPMEEWFDRLGEHIGYLHLSDNYGRYDNHLALGDGTIDWEKADELWRGLGRNLPITLEVGGVDNAKKSLEYLKQHGWFCGGKDIR